MKQSDMEIKELEHKEEIVRLKEHAEVIKRQNQQMYLELEELSRADDYVREKLMRHNVVEKLK